MFSSPYLGYCTNMNDVYPNDSFPLSRIDQIVDAIIGHGMLSFIDSFSKYHQIPMFQSDEEKTTFITPHGLYCYKVMSFRLKNVGTTYQKLITKIFKSLIGRIVEVYIGNIVFKSGTRAENIQYIEETFCLMRAYNMKLDPTKCAFGVSAWKFLGFMVTQRGIEVNPDQIKVVLEIPAPSSKKELQLLTSHLIVLGHFIAHFTNKLRHFFLMLRGANTFG